MPGWLASRLARQFIAALAMAASLYGVRLMLTGWFFGTVGERVVGLAALVGIGGAVYFAVAWLIGGIDRQAISDLKRKREPSA